MAISLCVLAPAFADPGAVRLPGHTLAGLPAKSGAGADPEPMTLTFVLRRDDEAGFQRYLRDLYDAKSPAFGHFLSAQEQAERFGPSQQVYAELADWLRARNFVDVDRSSNRLSLTMRAARADVEAALAVHVGDHAGDGRTFYANDADPALPAELAAHVQSIAGLSDRARPAPLSASAPPPQYYQCPADQDPAYCDLYGPLCAVYAGSRATGEFLMDLEGEGKGIRDFVKSYNSYNKNVQDYYEKCLDNDFGRESSAIVEGGGVPWSQIDGSGQTIGLVEFDQYQTSDIAAFLELIGSPPEQIDHLSEVNIGAGASFGGAESEVVLDIDVAMSLAPAADVVVYSAAFSGGGSFQQVFNRMIGDGVDVISNSWAYCENQTTSSDLDGIDTILESAAVAGISVFSGSGDSGSTCLNGASNTVAVPAVAPHITAVGGTSLVAGAGGVHQGETWWDGSNAEPRTGQGGFGVSRYFTRPSYQDGFTTSPMRSVPDVSIVADPATGMVICQADAGGCPTGLIYGGTSMAAPVWGAFAALLNQAGGANLGFVNARFYPLATTDAFHDAASMGSDFAHVGLGSPDLGTLNLLLQGQSAGAVSASESDMLATAPPVLPFTENFGVPADGATPGVVIVTLRDANGNTVAGKTVALAANAGSHATITPPNGVSRSDGVVVFKVTDLTVEELTFTATDTTDGITLAAQQKLPFIGAPATTGGIVAAPTTQEADGTSFSTITVTLVDGLGRPAEGKLVRLRQSGSSLIFGDNPAPTDANGHAVFQVTDAISEPVAYDAFDVTDGDLPVPGFAVVTWQNGIGCGTTQAPSAAPGYAISLYASGFPVQNGVVWGGITVSGCVGVGGFAFDPSGHLFASDYVTGDVYDIPPGGAIVTDANRITATPLGTSLGGLTFGGDGNLYGIRLATTGDFTTGAVLRINTGNGMATPVSSNLPCPFNIATDPLSGDLFVTDGCTGAGSDNASIWRVGNLGGTPATSVYAQSSGSPNGGLAFADDGTLYVVHSYLPIGGEIDIVSGTNHGAPTVTPTDIGSTFTVTALGSAAAGGAQALVVGASRTGGYAQSVAAYDMSLSPPAFSGAVLEETGAGSVRIVGPDGCFYLNAGVAIYRLSNADGTCPAADVLAPNPSLVIEPVEEPTLAPQGTALHFNIDFPHMTVPIGTPVAVVVSGANALETVAFMGFGSAIPFAYVGRNIGFDTVVAYGDVGGETVVSNRVPVQWTGGLHTTFLTLNGSAVTGGSGGAAGVTATLLDLSVDPPLAIPNADVTFTIGAASCIGTTNASGVASCSVALGAPGVATLTASFAGTTALLPATDTLAFHVLDDRIFADGFDGD
ncbi:MAG TPA: protease pro-enzyme activation domain-containing protein [Rhodanobacteraceae bacterium]|nr:protease pro-enzyme activation domain-containing protein [Rhodanobacteraceae bacterium]